MSKWLVPEADRTFSTGALWRKWQRPETYRNSSVFTWLFLITMKNLTNQFVLCHGSYATLFSLMNLDWLIYCYLMSNDQYFSYIQITNIYLNRFEDTIWLTRNRKSKKNRQNNGQKKWWMVLWKKRGGGVNITGENGIE
jgi:hypothetical protein